MGDFDVIAEQLSCQLPLCICQPGKSSPRGIQCTMGAERIFQKYITPPPFKTDNYGYFFMYLSDLLFNYTHPLFCYIFLCFFTISVIPRITYFEICL